ncbi:TerC family protein [Belnapia sp. T6]|uniref:TerC family protein n=1 Tax=Belnapia mucosa TaxID=2804532 RepID=A0ABS1VBT4_9PROT|nr:TerC family protein [Belnapia mucosa]MBL6459130.1 TerC family protein [Belnapia mucosa]
MNLSFLPPDLVALAGVLLVDIALAGDNAVVVGMAAAGLAPEQRRLALLWGIGAATAMRIGFSLITTQLLTIIGLTLAGGILLLWVCWRMFRELRHAHLAAGTNTPGTDDEATNGMPRKTLHQAVVQILVADVSMSLDNVLAVAGLARDHLWVLVVGLAASVVMMGIAATIIARLLGRYPWISWIGLLVILYVALEMIWTGWHEVADTL